MRVAIYYTPATDDPLVRTAANWLGRDAFSDTATRLPDPQWDQWVSEPRRYGFHATLKAPFRILPGRTLDDLESALASLAGRLQPVALGKLKLSWIGRFLALTAPEAGPELSLLETEVRESLEPFRAALTDAEIARRRPETLTPSQRSNLLTWGYPHVGEDFRFHMTLSNGLNDADARVGLESRAQQAFSPHLASSRSLDALAIFVEDAPGAPFRVHNRLPLQTHPEPIPGS